MQELEEYLEVQWFSEKFYMKRLYSRISGVEMLVL